MVSEEEWRVQILCVTEKMRAYTRPFGTFLFHEEEVRAALKGTGAFVQFGENIFILTCEHVTCDKEISFSPFGNDKVMKYQGAWNSAMHPVDISVGQVETDFWHNMKADASVITPDRMDIKHQPSNRAELLFFRGYAGENSAQGFDHYEALASAYCSQEKEGTGNQEFFEIFWEPEQTNLVDEANSAGLKTQNPEGFSGSLVWNTKYLETIQAGNEWSPEMAVVTGILRRWDSGTKTLLAYRIENLRSWLQHERYI